MGEVGRVETKSRESITRSITDENCSSYLRRMSSGFSMSTFASSGSPGLQIDSTGESSLFSSPSKVYTSNRLPNRAAFFKSWTTCLMRCACCPEMGSLRSIRSTWTSIGPVVGQYVFWSNATRDVRNHHAPPPRAPISKKPTTPSTIPMDLSERFACFLRSRRDMARSFRKSADIERAAPRTLRGSVGRVRAAQQGTLRHSTALLKGLSAKYALQACRGNCI